VRRRHVAVGLGLVAITALAACSSGSAADQGPRKVAFVVANSQLNFAKEMSAGFRAGVAAVGGVDQTVTGPDIEDGAKELQIFQELTKSYRSGISVFTLAPDLFVEPLAAARHSGIPLIAVDNPAPPASGVQLFIGNDNYELGRILADQVIGRLPAGAKGTVIIGTTTPGVPVLDRRADGMRDRLTERLPGVKVVGPFDTKHEVASNLAAWKLLVQANPDALAFLATGDADGWHLAQIRRSTHGKWLAGAFDLDPRSLQAVKDGDLVLVSPEHYLKGAIAGRLQAEHARTGKALPKGWIYTPGLAVTPANIDEIITRQASPAAKESWFAPKIKQILDHTSTYLRPLSAAG
jgi:ribose transport system substrate-binding protein